MSPALLALALLPQGLAADVELPDWTAKIRRDHPRLFFNRETLPTVIRQREGVGKPMWETITRRRDELGKQLAERSDRELAPTDLGREAAWVAFIFLADRRPEDLELARRCLDASLRFYEQCLAERKPVNWYSTSRVHWVMAWDWLYDDLDPAERAALMERLIDCIDGVLTARPRIVRENYSGYNTGFYGVHNCLWFIGCTALGTGIREAKVQEWLVWGHDENLKLLAHRRAACGDDGGAASPTLGYALGAYPWAEQNFFYTWLSATGENIAPDWPHSAWLANYALWNAIPATEGEPYEFGYGDTPHTTNRLPTWELFTHLANIRHLFGQAAPEAAALARYLQGKLPAQRYSSTWFIYPFLHTELDASPPALDPTNLPPARYFEAMGQLFMRSGAGPDDTYCLFTVGGQLSQHRHYDALNFVIYKYGHQALDTGTRWEEFRNGNHLSQYYAQTVAHNCVLIHLAGEPTARYWGWVGGDAGAETDYPCYGGQYKAVGSRCVAFETNPTFTYVAGDATDCYRPEKCRQCTRQLVFLMPNWFVIFDRVVSVDPGQRKEWLIHPASEPAFDGNTFRSEHLGGAMLVRTLLPEQPRFRVVGGDGNEFRTGDINWDIYRGEPGARGALTSEQLTMIGRWRVEVSPPEESSEALFLHVIEVGDKALNTMVDTRLLRNGERVGARLALPGGPADVWFNTAGDLGGHIRIGEIDRPLTDAVTPQQGIMAQAGEGP